AINHVFARADDGVATRRAAGAKAFRFLQKPDPHLEPEVGRSERADWADVNGVERIIVFQPFSRMRGEDAVATPIDKPEHIVLRDLLAKANAARAKDAALVIERHPRTQLDVLRFLDFVLEETRIGPAVLDA